MSSKSNSNDLNTMCYLRNSGKFDNKFLDEFHLKIYDEILASESTDPRMMILARNFLIPYQISLMKFNLNQEYYENPIPQGLISPHCAAPSLIELVESQFILIPKEYPKWYKLAFPDVVLWTINTAPMRVAETIQERFKNQDIYEGRLFKPSILTELIDSYIANTGKPLECKFY